MLFNTTQFEQHFEEKFLKRGLKIFERGGVEMVERHGNSEFRFLCGKIELLLKKRGDKLFAYDCQCKQDNFCEHLSATLFYLQQETLGLRSLKKRESGKFFFKGTTGKITHQKLLHLIKGDYTKNSKETDFSLFRQTVNESLAFEYYRSLFNTLLEPYSSKGSLTTSEIEESYLHVTKFIKLINRFEIAFVSQTYLHLALLLELQSFLQLRFIGEETVFFELRDNCYTLLAQAFKKGLSATEKLAWEKATLLSLKNNTVMRSEAYRFLLPRLLSWLNTKLVFDELIEILHKRRFKPLYFANLNYLVIAKIQIYISENKLFKTSYPVIDSENHIEEIIASTELAFCNNHVNKGFKILESNYPKILTTHKHYFEEYSNYCILKAKEYNRTEVEIRFLEERLVKCLAMLPKDFERYLNLLQTIHQPERINTLIDLIRYNTRYYSFDKLSDIFQKINQPNELLKEIKKQDNAYRLLHGILIKKLPEFEMQNLVEYVKHLMGAMYQLKVHSHQQKLFETARDYIDNLPEESKDFVLDKIITYSGSESQISKYIRKIYNL